MIDKKNVQLIDYRILHYDAMIWNDMTCTKIIKRKILQTYLQGWRQTYFRTGVIIIMAMQVIIILLFISSCWTVQNTAPGGIRKSYYLVHRLWSEAELMYRRPAQCTRRRRRYLLFRMRFSLSSVVVKNQSRPSRPMHFFLTFLTSLSLTPPDTTKIKYNIFYGSSYRCRCHYVVVNKS